MLAINIIIAIVIIIIIIIIIIIMIVQMFQAIFLEEIEPKIKMQMCLKGQVIITIIIINII